MLSISLCSYSDKVSAYWTWNAIKTWIYYYFSLLFDKYRTLFSLSFFLDTKERKNQFSIEDVRQKFFIDRYTKRVISCAYQTSSAFRYRLRLEIFFILSLPIETKKKRIASNFFTGKLAQENDCVEISLLLTCLSAYFGRLSTSCSMPFKWIERSRKTLL